MTRWLIAATAVYFVLGISVCLILLWRAPLQLLRFTEILPRRADLKLPEKLGGMRLRLRYVLFVGLFEQNRRVLDAWIEAQAPTARRSFREKPTVRDRRIRVQVPVLLNDELVPNLTPEHLRQVFETPRGCVLIHGEGGAGKTSLACEIALWGMADEVSRRLVPGHLILPVLLEHDFEYASPSGGPVLLDAIRGELTNLLGLERPLDRDWLRHLLRRRQVVVIIDSVSELSEATRRAIGFGHPEFPVNALMVTSRVREELGGIQHNTIQPQRIAERRIGEFLGDYLSLRESRSLFDTDEFQEMCQKLRRMMSGADISVLFAKLYVDQVVLGKKGLTAEVPGTIPDIALMYLNEINRAGRQRYADDRAIHRAAKKVAWACVRKRYRSGRADRIDVLIAIEDEPDPEVVLRDFEQRLKLVATIGPGRNVLVFTLDALAEYLAAMFVVEANGADLNRWREFLQHAQAVPGSREERNGFLSAVRDCCLAYEGQERVPPEIFEKLERLLSERDPRSPTARSSAEWPAEAVTTRRNAIERRAAVKAAGRAGLRGVPVLIGFLRDADAWVQQTAIDELRGLGSIVILDIIVAMESGDDSLFDAGARVLNGIGGRGGRAIPYLCNTLNVASERVKVVLLRELAAAGPRAVSAVPTLMNIAEADHGEVRWLAIRALRAIGRQSGAALSVLTRAISDDDMFIRLEAVKALGAIGEPRDQILVAVALALHDPKDEVRDAAARVITDLKQLLPERISSNRSTTTWRPPGISA
jgi:HEAT repeat protein/cation transport regulator ChaB